MDALFGAFRRNRRRVILFSMAGTGLAVAFYYARAQYTLITSALAAERSAGARSLRLVYTASRRTVEATLRALLDPGRERIAACDAANPDPLVARLKEPAAEPGGKERTWEELKVAAIVRLVASVYYLVAVYVVLLVQVNLVARYSTSDADAPVEALAGGRLELGSKQRFLSLARRRLFEQGGIEALVGAVEDSTREVVGGMRLSEKVGPVDVRDFLRQICRSVEMRCGLRTGGGGEEDASASGQVQPVLDVAWLLAHSSEGPGSDSGASSSGSAGDDYNVRLLVEESLDLCDILKYGQVFQTSVNALMDVAGGMVDASLWGVGCAEGGRTVALAPVVAKIANVSKSVLGHANASDMPGARRSVQSSIDITASDGPFVDALLQMGECYAFGAAVFLSGEKTS